MLTACFLLRLRAFGDRRAFFLLLEVTLESSSWEFEELSSSKAFSRAGSIGTSGLSL